MTTFQRLNSVLVVALLVLSFAGSVFAAEQVSTTTTEYGRTQIILEFDDAEEAKWAAEYIGKMKAKNIFSGYPDGTFRPNQPVKRVESIVTAVRLMGLEEEAKAKSSSDIKLHFKDAELIDKQYSWAKGYVIVALENGLFDSSETQIQPDKPASRVWVASLLVRALGLQSEALKQMTTIPEFTDADVIPAGAIGYINVAVDYDIVSGYPDNTFKPNTNVTRAEMATLLERTNDGLLENSGAITVLGKVTDITFDTNSVVNEVNRNGSVTDDVYTSMNGTITIESFNGDFLTYSISSKLLVQYHERFIHADQLLVDDAVSLVVQDEKVVEAALVDKEAIEGNDLGLLEFKVKVELGDEEEYKLKYKNKNGKVSGEIEKKTDGHKTKIKGEEAEEAVEAFVKQLALSVEMTKEEFVQAVLAALEIEENKFKELEIEIKLANGKKIEIEMENEDMFDEGYLGIREFKLNIETKDEGKLKIEYKHEEGEVEAKVEKKTDGIEETNKGDEAVSEIETLLDKLALSEEMDKDEVFESILTVLGVDKDKLKKLEVEIHFTNDNEIEIEIENEDEEDEDED